MYSGSVKLFSSYDSPRLRYIAGILLGDILGLPYEIISDKRRLGKHPVINYSDEKIPGAFRINPEPILFESGISRKEIIVTEWKFLPVFFNTTGDSDLPFDIFAASFFLVSRYEEYLEFKPDIHGRFPASASVAFLNGFLDKPVVDLWAHELAKSLLKKFPSLVFKRNVYKALLTVDSDQAFEYIGKNIFRSMGPFSEKGTSQISLSARYRIISKSEKDPFDVFDYILDCIRDSRTDSRFFFPVGDHSKYDKNPSWKNEEYRKLINKISSEFIIGLHPSFMAGGNDSLIVTEKGRLKTILNKEITSGRFHYLRLKMPQSYNSTAKAGITEDYSMGYPDEPGFRAGISRPYCFYDVSADHQTTLQIVPFQVMDATLFEYKKLDPKSAMELIMKMISETRKAGGLFVSIWHNTSLLDNEMWREWRKVFEFTIKNQQ
jgi:hypothetical protein